MINKMRIMGKDPENLDDPGTELLVLENVASPPREFEKIMVNGIKCLVLKGGVLWNFNQFGIFVTVAVTAVEYEDEG